ncbi:MAG: DUF4136 domain-containing protein [Candidatus Acidiferrum sp.]
MLRLHPGRTNRRILGVAAVLSVILAVGCDEYVRVIRDHDVRIPVNATWAWRPAAQEAATTRNEASGNRPVISRDALSRNQAVPPETQADDAVDRQRVKSAIENALASKGFKQVADPAAADFLVDFKFAVKRRNATVPVAYPGTYSGLVCGPFRCWPGWGYGPAFVGYERIHFREGMIVFDWMQRANKHLVYRAIGAKPVRRDSFSLSQNDINGLVQKLLKDLKPSK